jgi:hypothetical protein
MNVAMHYPNKESGGSGTYSSVQNSNPNVLGIGMNYTQPITYNNKNSDDHVGIGLRKHLGSPSNPSMMNIMNQNSGLISPEQQRKLSNQFQP